VGDRVAVSKYSGFNIEDPDTGELFRLCNDEDVLCVIRS
jgi:co-chaperonin GroES (HSP10)